MEPKCTQHPDKQGKYFCKICGFLCNPEEDNNREHTFTRINKNDSKLIALLQKSMHLNTTKKNYIGIQSQIQLMIKQNISQIDKKQAEIGEEIENIKDPACLAQARDFKKFIKISEKEVVKDTDELISKLNIELTLSMHSLGSTLKKEMVAILSSYSKPNKEMSKFVNRQFDQRIPKREE